MSVIGGDPAAQIPDSTTTLVIAAAKEAKDPAEVSVLSTVWRTLKRNKVAQGAAVVLLLIVLVGIFGPLIAPHDPQLQNLAQRLKPPAWMPGAAEGHLLGTDSLGRDVFSRVLLGARVSLLVGVSATVISGLLGTLVGIVSGFIGGRLDTILMRIADVQLAYPTILLALVIVVVLKPSLGIVVFVLGINGWMSYARVIRSEVLSLRGRDYVTAARAIGDSDLQIMWRHIRPNIMAPLLTIGTLQVASMIVAEASLSYLGFGVPPTVPTWGGMLAEGQLYITTAWWIAVFSGGAIVITTLSINILGDMLRDVADPKAYR